MQRNIEAIKFVDGSNGKFGSGFIKVGKPDRVCLVDEDRVIAQRVCYGTHSLGAQNTYRRQGNGFAHIIDSSLYYYLGSQGFVGQQDHTKRQQTADIFLYGP